MKGKRATPSAFRRVVVAVDGSAHARRAVALVARLTPPPGGRVTLVHVLERAHSPSLGLLPAGTRARIAAELGRLERDTRARAQRALDAAASTLAEAGWRVQTRLRTGVPLREVLAAAAAEQADVLVLGARGTGGVERLLLGSVADGALRHATMPVLIAR